jgi:hypothetical protein
MKRQQKTWAAIWLMNISYPLWYPTAPGTPGVKAGSMESIRQAPQDNAAEAI